MVDASDAAIGNARITLLSAGTGDTRHTVSSSEGYFAFPGTPRGEYRLTVSAPGFRETVMGPFEITVGQHLTVNPRLEVGAISERVEVMAEAPPVTTSSSSVSQLVDTKRIEQLPLNRRNLPKVCTPSRMARCGQMTVQVSGLSSTRKRSHHNRVDPG